MSSADRQTDASRDGSGQIQKKNVSIDSDFWRPITTDQEMALGGWDPKAAPTGGIPAPTRIQGGNRGAVDDAVSEGNG